MPETGFEILPAILMTSGQAETGILCGQLTGRVAESRANLQESCRFYLAWTNNPGRRIFLRKSHFLKDLQRNSANFLESIQISVIV